MVILKLENFKNQQKETAQPIIPEQPVCHL